MRSWNIGSLLETAADYLKDKGSPSARLDAELLLADALHLERIDLYVQHDRPLGPQEVAAYRTLIARRAAHEPIAYIRGKAYFRHLTVRVEPGVLIPRPETEELVDLALASLRLRPIWEALPDSERPASPVSPLPGRAAEPAASPSPRPARAGRELPAVADIGTGSGAIALSLAQEGRVRVLAVDESADALSVAGTNAQALELSDRVVLRKADLLEGIPDAALALVVSNPPYVRSEDLASLAPDIRLFEPLAALDGGRDGLDVYRRLIPGAARALRPGGSLLVEVGHDQAAAVSALARETGFAIVSVGKDLSRKDRMIEATLPGAPRRTMEELGDAEIKALSVALDSGAVIGLPTDTVYGIAVRWDLATGIRRLFAAKERPPEQPVQVLFASVEAIQTALPDLDPVAADVLAALLPGPYTFVVSTSVPRPDRVGTPDSLGVRVPDHPDLLRLLAVIRGPLAATSANPTGSPAAATVDEVDPAVLAHCSLAVVPGARSKAVAGVASTVVDLRPLTVGGQPVVLREGAVSQEEVLTRIAARR